MYGMMRFRDLLNDHESMITEAERSRQYSKFVNDRLAGYQAWKNTLEKETKIYEEISSSIDPEYFKEYNKFMEDYPATSCAEGYRVWFKETYESIEKMRKEVNDLTSEQEQFENTLHSLEDEMKELIQSQEIERITYEDAIKAAENDEKLSHEFIEGNNKNRENGKKLLFELEEELQKVEKEMTLLEEEQNVAKKTMLKNIQQIQNYSNELTQLQEALEKDSKDIIKTFLKNHAAGVAHLDEALQRNMEELGRMAQELDTHNDNIKKTEEDIKTYSDNIKARREELDDITKVHEEATKKVQEDVKEQKSIGSRFVRLFVRGEKKEALQAKLDAAESQQNLLEAYEEIVKDLKKNVETNENYLNDSRNQLESYRNGWHVTKKTFSEKIKEGIAYTQELQIKLDALEKDKEAQTAKLDYTNKIKEIQTEAGENQKVYQNILDKTSDEFDRLKLQQLQKLDQKKKILEKIQGAKDLLESCDKADEEIRTAQEKKENALKVKEAFEKSKNKKISELQKDIDDTMDMAARGKIRLEEKKQKCETKIKSHDKMAEFYKQKKVTSDRVLKDLNAALKESFNIAARESKKQLRYIKQKENYLMNDYLFKMKLNKEAYADRMKAPAAVKSDPQAAVNDLEAANNNPEKKEATLDCSIRAYMKQLSAMKKSNSREFQALEKAVLKNLDEFNNFLLDDEISDAVRIDRNREETMRQVKEHMQEIADASKAYMQAKGSASRFTDAGKLRYRFADEMNSLSEAILKKFQILEKEKTVAEKLMNMDDSGLLISKDTSFYKTDSYKMTRQAFVKEGEIDQMNKLAYANLTLPGEKKEEIKKETENVKEEKVTENVSEKEELILEDNEASML